MKCIISIFITRIYGSIHYINKIITTYIEKKVIKLVTPILIYTINYYSINIFDSIIPMN